MVPPKVRAPKKTGEAGADPPGAGKKPKRAPGGPRGRGETGATGVRKKKGDPKQRGRPGETGLRLRGGRKTPGGQTPGTGRKGQTKRRRAAGKSGARKRGGPRPPAAIPKGGAPGEKSGDVGRRGGQQGGNDVAGVGENGVEPPGCEGKGLGGKRREKRGGAR